MQANGRDILGANCTVSLASSMPTLNDGLDRDNISDQPAAAGERLETAVQVLPRGVTHSHARTHARTLHPITDVLDGVEFTLYHFPNIHPRSFHPWSQE